MSSHDQPPMVVPPYSSPVPVHPQLPPVDYDAEIDQGLSLQEYLHILLKRKWWIIGAFLFVFVGVALFTFLRTPIYRTAVLLQITQENPSSKLSMEDALATLSGSDSLEKFQQTQYKILESQSLALRVIQALNLKEYPDFRVIKEENPEKSEHDIENLMIKKFLELDQGLNG